MPGNIDRKHSKRELERAQGNISHAMEHIDLVGTKFYETSLDLANRNQDVPDEYVEILDGLNAIKDGLETLKQLIEKVEQSI